MLKIQSSERMCFDIVLGILASCDVLKDLAWLLHMGSVLYSTYRV